MNQVYVILESPDRHSWHDHGSKMTPWSLCQKSFFDKIHDYFEKAQKCTSANAFAAFTLLEKRVTNIQEQ